MEILIIVDNIDFESQNFAIFDSFYALCMQDLKKNNWAGYWPLPERKAL